MANSSQLGTVSTWSAIATFLLNRISPMGGLLGGQVSVPAAAAQLMEDLNTGELTITNVRVGSDGNYIIDIPMSYDAVALTGRMIGLIGAAGAVAGAASAAPAAVVAGVAGGMVLVLNPAIQDEVTIPRQSRGLSVAGPSKGPTRDGQKPFLRLLQPAILELDAL